MEIPFHYKQVRVSPPLTFIGDDSAERRSSLTLPVKENKIVELHDPVDAVSCNKTQDRIVCAGSRGVLRVFRVTDKWIIPELDLKKVAAKNKSRTPLLYSPSNVAWSKLRDDLIATTSTIGAVVLWNVEQQKIENHWKVHTRSATVVRFHRHNESIMISGSKDGIIAYDIRMPEVTKSFRNGTETVRDLTFSQCPGDTDIFLSADDGGIVKVWDLRNNATPLKARSLHTGYISCIQSHPKRPHEVASGGGRDKIVRIWDWKAPEEKRVKEVETYAPVGRINWRPDNEYQFASCAVVNDMSVLIWDTRRPHLPMVSYPGHKDSVTDVFWSRMEPHRFVSVGKDGLAMLHNVDEGDLTIDHLCDAQVDVAPDGLVVIGVNSENEEKRRPKWEISGEKMQLNKGNEKRREAVARAMEKRSLTGIKSTYEPFSHNVRSDVVAGIPSAAQFCLQNRLFEKYAKFYQIGGHPIADMCEYNAVVSAHQGDEVRERLWRYVAGLLAEADFQELYDKEDEERKAINEKKWKMFIKSHESQGTTPLLPPTPKPDLPFEFLVNFRNVRARDNASTIKEEDSKIFEFFTTLSVNREFVGADPDALKSEEPLGDEFCGLPAEAFGQKRYFQDPSATTVTEENSWRNEAAREQFKPVNVLVRTLHFLAHQGDVQMCACICTIAGHKLTETLSDYFIEAWVQSYMDMLYRLELYPAIAALRKWTCVRRIREEGNEGVFIRPLVHHAKRNPQWGDPKLMASANPPPGYVFCKGKLKNGRCDACTEPIMPICSICDEAIEGITWNCNKCCHSMHLDHAALWFRQRIKINDLSGVFNPKETPAERRLRLVENDCGEIIDLTTTKCPIRECPCDCLREEDDKPDPNHYQIFPYETIDLQRRNLMRSKLKKKAERRDSKQKKAEKQPYDLRFKPPTYDFVPKDEKLLKTLVAAAKTRDELRFCILLKMIMAIPEEKKAEIKARIEAKSGKKKDEKKEKEEEIPAAVRLGLTTMEKIWEKEAKRASSKTPEEVKRERKEAAERNLRRARETWKESLEPRARKMRMEDDYLSEREQLIEKERLLRAPHFDVIRCIFWGLIRRLVRLEKRRKKVILKKGQDRVKKFKAAFDAVEESDKPEAVRKFVREAYKRHLHDVQEDQLLQKNIRRASEHASAIINFIGFRVKPFWITKNHRLRIRAGRGRSTRREINENIAKVFKIHRFTIHQREAIPVVYPSRGLEPAGIVPASIEEALRARQISTARHTTASSGPATPRPTIDFQI